MYIFDEPLDPNEVLDFVVECGSRLKTGESISTAVFTLPANAATDGLVKVQEDIAGSNVAVWLQGGVDGQDYDINLHFKTSEAREFEETIRVKVRSK